MPSGHGGVAAGFTVRRTTTRKPTHRYGLDRSARSRLGMVTVGGDIRVFLQKAAVGTSPGITTPAADGSALVLTLEVGCTLSGTAVFPDLSIDHAFDDPAIEGTHTYEFNGAVTETWATA